MIVSVTQLRLCSFKSYLICYIMLYSLFVSCSIDCVCHLKFNKEYTYLLTYLVFSGTVVSFCMAELVTLSSLTHALERAGFNPAILGWTRSTQTSILLVTV